ncbi:MAG: hypothetical protein HZB23_10725 [Deltaproteobacteria bacterium]|nr:hypothetical protein [Deltaproteobacteria bacterium]
MAFSDLRRCPRCGKLSLEDDRMYQDVSVCPHCGANLYDRAAKEPEEPLNPTERGA